MLLKGLSHYTVRFFCICFVFCLCEANYAQHNTGVGIPLYDSLLSVAENLRKTDPNKSIELLTKINSSIELPKHKKVLYAALVKYALVYFTLRNIDSCNYYAKKYLAEAIYYKDTASITEAYQNLAYYYAEQNEFVLQEDALIEALKLVESRKDTLKIISCRSSLANIMLTTKRYEHAEKYIRNALQLALLKSEKRYLGILYSELGLLYFERKNWDSAFINRDKAEKIFIEDGNFYSAANCKLRNAKYYILINRLQEAKNELDTAELWLRQVKANQKIVLCEITRGEILLKEGKTSQGIKLISSVFQENRNQLNLNTSHAVFALLCDAYFDIGDIEKAKRICDTAKFMKDSLLSETVLKEVSQLEVAYRTEQKEKQVGELKLMNEITNLKLKQERWRKYGLIFGLIGLAGLLYWILQLYTKTKYQKEIIEKSLAEKETLLREIHHRVKNNLQFISSLLNLQSRHLTDSNALTALKEGQNRVKSMALIHQNLYQEGNLVGVDCRIYIESLIKNLFNSYNISNERIQLKLYIEEIQLDLDTMIPLGLVINELISNALKYAFPGGSPGEIRVALREESGKLHLEVIDNGIGITEVQKSNLGQSFGYRLIYSLVDQLDGTIRIDASNGTRVIIERQYIKKHV